MAKVYKTISGDTWDIIAKKVYGDEKYTTFLMENNKNMLLGYFIFPAGVEVTIEELPKEDISNMPEWRN